MQQTIDETSAEIARMREQQQQRMSSINTAEEQMEKLRQDLAQAQQDAESLRATASVNDSLGGISAENSDKTISEQLTERVEAIRAELEARYNERVAQLEENYKKRVDAMRTQLNAKLAEGREKAKQSVAAENDQVLQGLKASHEDDLELLRARHQSELADLKQNEESRFSQFKEAWVSEHPATNKEDSAVKPEGQEAKPVIEISEADARTLIQTNSLVRGVLRKTVETKVNEAKEAVTLQLKEEHEKDLADRLAEAQSKANTAKEHAVSMEQKRNQLKVSMSENKAKLANAKLAVVQTAANETPRKPVVEVWEIAKSAKPAPAPPSATTGNTSGQQSASASSNEKPAPASAQSTQVQGQKPTPTPFGQPSTSVQGSQPQARNPPQPSLGQPSAPLQGAQLQNQKPSTSSFGKPSFAQPPTFGQPSNLFQGNQPQAQKPAPISPFGLPPNYQPQSPSIQGNAHQPPPQLQQPATQLGLTQEQPNNAPTQASTAQPATDQNANASQREQNPVNGTQQPTRQPPSQPNSNIPQKPQGQNNPFAQGSGPAAARSLQQSSLPIAARGGANRGAGNQRGRGRGRGGGHNIEAQGPQQGRASPTSAGLNPGARQFVPGNKRPREEGQDGQQGDEIGNGKRIRGGGGGS